MRRRDLIGGWYMGWIARPRYLAALAILALIGVPVVLAGIEAARLRYGDFNGWGSQVRAAHTVTSALWFCCVLNLIARRFRDSGLPGWMMAGLVFAIGFAILAQYLVEAGPFAIFPDRVTLEGLAWGGAWVGGAALAAAIPPTDCFPWVVDRDRWAVFD